MPQPKDHAVERNFIETVLRHIPGFRGYLEREYRRESDELQRDWLADRLQRSKRAVDELARQLVDAAEVDSLPQIDRMRVRLDRLLGRIRGAMQGYSGFFDLVRIDEPLLEEVYEHDASLDEQVDAFTQSAEQLPDKRDQVPAAVAELLARIDEIERRWDEREDMLKGVDSG
ncbi:MAG: hypothetical protein KKE86_12950 [Planctomycetes bacterium]|nr:hypothetical protein [Planctomycetota bacterium]MBU4400230.1 hypothetical protein [Planctomycetota bacterium]MCG2684023.1 hypothetical protein [Planctomycetales bacterium]